MQCPNCKTHSLLNADLECDLPCLRCTNCGGVLVSAPAYGAWLDSGAPLAPQGHTAKFAEPAPSDNPDWRCPLCQDDMDVLSALALNGFAPHACTACELVWMTGAEWLQLRKRAPTDPVAEGITRLGQRRRPSR